MVANITLPQDLTDRIQILVADGDYPDAETAIREAVQLLEDQIEEQRFMESLEEGRRAHAEGRSIPWNEETRARIRASAVEMIRDGVIPIG
jgi:Arc/MetJ-type ribon-helix-helix transcriptional regulator